VDRWSALPERTRAEVLALLARLIARGILVDAPPVAAVAEDVGGSDE
jgi:hypothetical protein